MSRVPIRLPEYVIEWIKEGTHVRVVEPNNASDIQVKLNDVEALGYGVVIVPPGLYIGKKIVVPPNIALLGCGLGTVIKLANGVNDSVIQNKNHFVNSGDSNIIIGFLQVDGNGSNQTGFSIGIDMMGTVDSMIIGCYVHDTYADGLGFWGAPKRCIIANNISRNCNHGSWNAIFLEGEAAGDAEDCVVVGNIGINSASDGLHLDYVVRCIFIGNVCTNNATNGIIIAHSYESIIVGNICKSNTQMGIKADTVYNCVFNENIIRENGSNGMWIVAPENCTVNDNSVYDNGGDGINLESSPLYCSVCGNVCKNNDYAGIHILTGVGCIVDNNTCSFNGTQGIYIYQCQYCGITCNVCANNSQSGVGSYDGIILSDGNATPYCRYNTVIGNKCFDNQGTPTQRYGIVCVDSEDYNLIVANNCYQNQHASLDIYYTGSNDKVAWNIGRYSGQGDIREVWAPVTFGSPGLSQWDGHPGVTIDASGEYCAVGLTVPEDYGSTVSVELLFIAHETAASQHLTINVYWGKVGEQRNNHFSGGADRNLGAVTNGQIHSHDVSDLLSPLEAGDVVGFYIEYSSTDVDSNVMVLGVRFRYQNKDI